MNSDLLFLGHIADSIAAIETYTANGRAEFLRERMVQDAVEISRLSARRQARFANQRAELGATWTEVVAFRNRLIHDYCLCGM